MNRRITKDMARNAANKIANDLYVDMISAVDEDLTRFADDCIKQVLPMPVTQVIEEFKEYFSYCTNVVISDGNGHSFYAKSTIKVPANYYYIYVNQVMYEQGKKIYLGMQELKNKRESFITETTNLLYQELKFEKKVAEVAPEMLSYIEFPEVVAPPSRTLYYTQLNTLLKKIKNRRNEREKTR